MPGFCPFSPSSAGPSRAAVPILALAVLGAAPLWSGHKKPRKGGLPPAPQAAAADKARVIHKYRVVNGHKVKPGADLRGADLSWGDLTDCDLTGADLRGADCRRARFCGAILTGADLRNAQFAHADLGGSVGADLTGADLHPFFERPHHEEAGDFAFFRIRVPEDPGPGKVPTALACSADGILFWLAGPGTPLRLVTPTGVRFLFTDRLDQVMAMAKDVKERLWCFGPEGVHVLDLRALGKARTRTGFPCRSYPFPVKEPPAGLVPGSKGEIWVSIPPNLTGLSISKKNVLVCDHWEMGEEVMTSPRAFAAPAWGETCTVLLDPERDRVLTNQDGEESWRITDLPPGSRPRRLTHGPGGKPAFTQADPAAVVQVDLKADRILFRRLPEVEGKRDPRGLCLGPDGNLWYTDPAAGRIGRLTPEGDVKEFPLPRGLRPAEIVPGHDGRLFFTVEGRAWIGSVVAVSRAPGVPLQPPRGEDGQAAPAPRPEPRKVLTRAERRHLLEQRIQRAERRQRARMEQEAKQAPVPDGKAGKGEALPEAKDPQPQETKQAEADAPAEEAPPGPVERLAALGVNLTPAVTRHILSRHGSGKNPDKSQFHEKYSTPAGLEELLAVGVEESGAIAKVRVSDSEGRHFTLCARKDAGWRRSQGQWVPTDRFVVVTAKYVVGGSVEHDVITAYPVSEHW